MGEPELAVQLPVTVAQDRGAVRQIGMAGQLSLRPVADVVLADHAVGSRHAHQGAQVDKQALQPQRTAIRAMDQAPVHAERMAKADRRRRGGEEQRQCSPGEEQRPGDERSKRHRRDPQGLDGVPVDGTADSVGIVRIVHAHAAERALRQLQRVVNGIYRSRLRLWLRQGHSSHLVRSAPPFQS
jgi:hypothetical protein